MKKVLSLVMAVIMLFSCAVFASAQDNIQLQFDENGKFKILVLADIQSGYPVGEALKAYIAEALDETEPNLVIFLGDNIMGAEDGTEESYLKGYDEVLPILEEREIPFTLVFGNHDYESAPDSLKDHVLEIYQSYNGCLAYDAEPSLHGCGTHNLPILDSKGEKTVFNLWLFDSGDYAYDENGDKHGYDCVRADQIEWYKNKSNELKTANGGQAVPSLAFQHIVTQEVTQKLMVSLPFQIEDDNGKHFDDGTEATRLQKFFAFSGFVDGLPRSSLQNEGQWDAFVEQGDVLACFFGHDHKNNCKTTVDGVDAIIVPSASFKAGHSFFDQGATLITLNEKNLSKYKTEGVYTSTLAVKKNSGIPNQENSETVAGYLLRSVCRVLVRVLLTVVFPTRLFYL